MLQRNASVLLGTAPETLKNSKVLIFGAKHLLVTLAVHVIEEYKHYWLNITGFK